MRKNIIVAIVLMFTVILAGCSREEAEPLLGQWSDSTSTIWFYEGGTYIYRGLDSRQQVATQQGTWRRTGSGELMFSVSAWSMSATYSVSGNTLVLDYEDGSHYTMTRQDYTGVATATASPQESFEDLLQEQEEDYEDDYGLNIEDSYLQAIKNRFEDDAAIGTAIAANFAEYEVHEFNDLNVVIHNHLGGILEPVLGEDGAINLRINDVFNRRTRNLIKQIDYVVTIVHQANENSHPASAQRRWTAQWETDLTGFGNVLRGTTTPMWAYVEIHPLYSMQAQFSSEDDRILSVSYLPTIDSSMVVSIVHRETQDDEFINYNAINVNGELHRAISGAYSIDHTVPESLIAVHYISFGLFNSLELSEDDDIELVSLEE